MNELKGLKSQLKNLAPNEGAQKLCAALIDHMRSLPDDQLKMLTFVSICKAVGRNRVDEEMLQALAVLTGTRLEVLDSHFLFIDDDQEEYEIAKSEFVAAKKNGVFIHPDRGDEVEDFEAKIVMFFAASSKFLKIKSAVE